MKPFRFTLQRVLDVKVLLEEQQQLALAAAERRLGAATEQLRKAEDERQAAVSRGNDADVGVDPLMRSLNWHGRLRLRARVRQQQEETEQRRSVRDEERNGLITRHQERRVLELLQQKQRNEHNREQLYAQQRFIDDLVGGAYVRKERTRGDG